MIKSKIEARERAWGEAARIAFEKKTVTVMTTDDIVRSAEKIANFLIGSAELPEINSKEEDVIQSFIEALLKNIKTPTPDYDYMGLLRGNAELCNQIETRSHDNKK